ncbi:MAG: FHA domain-containing protein [Candidatus Cloacimonadaceae bacterium]|nr:FHA domain-containing protein [Candidatus Cloacimonadaceae bacterium]MDP3114963.1 FHA domain-containing protein [Candidatus Cloacimonadaceae bacterium]
MKCPKCQVDNPAGGTFCKSCGAAMQQSYKTCKNGHNYDAAQTACPFCPAAEMTLSGAKTQIDSPTNRQDKTVIDNATPKLAAKVAGGNREDKTMIFGAGTPCDSTVPAQSVGIRKLVGWLITFDINPAGIDYKLSIGRHRIGRNATCDIVLQQPGVSDEHAVLLYRDCKFILQDMLSTNGTFVNGELVDEKVTLNNDDIIRIGNVDLKLKII